MCYFLRRARFLVVFLCLVGVGSVPLFAQFKYNPDDEVIEEMARRGVRFLEGNTDPAGSGANGAQMALIALTINEVSKRYDRLIARDNPHVVAAIRGIKAVAESTFSDGREYANLYHPALSVIVLCDVDDQEYEPYIKKILKYIEELQQGNGSYNYPHKSRNGGDVGDISQTQYACLAMFVAKHHGFRVNPDVAKRALEWLMAAQTNSSWFYHTRGNRPATNRPKEQGFTLSRHCCGAGSIYLLSDLLRLNPRVKKKSNAKVAGGGGLPPSVSIYVKPKSDAKPGSAEAKEGPLVRVDGGRLANCKRQANNWFGENFTTDIGIWNYYYLYALERYAYFREVAEGEVSEIPNWYDQGVEFLMTQQDGSGGFPSTSVVENEIVATCLAVLFLVRSSEVLILPSNDSLLRGGQGFEENKRLTAKNGKISSQAAIQGIDDVTTMLQEDTSDAELETLAEAMDQSIRKFKTDEKSRGQTMAFITELVKHRNYFRRLIAVKILAREQDMDHVPALLYALGDPDIRVAKEAHNGLRLISRKIEAFELPRKPSLTDFQIVKRQWTDWYLQLRPNAELID